VARSPRSTAGFAWLAFGMKLGVDKAWLVGVAPFVVASLIKNALRAALVPEIRRVFDRRHKVPLRQATPIDSR
jgi:biotin transporter BioY